jgi:hypothetical protein
MDIQTSDVNIYKKYYYRNPSTFKLIQLLSVRNVKELNNIGKYLYIAEKIRKTGN